MNPLLFHSSQYELRQFTKINKSAYGILVAGNILLNLVIRFNYEVKT